MRLCTVSCIPRFMSSFLCAEKNSLGVKRCVPRYHWIWSSYTSSGYVPPPLSRKYITQSGTYMQQTVTPERKRGREASTHLLVSVQRKKVVGQSMNGGL